MFVTFSVPKINSTWPKFLLLVFIEYRIMAVGGVLMFFVFPFDGVTAPIKTFGKYKRPVLVKTLFSNFELRSFHFIFFKA